MIKNVEYAVVGLTALEGIAIRHILRENLGMSADFFESYADLLPFVDRYEAIVMSSSELLVNLESMLPRKHSVIAVDSRRTEYLNTAIRGKMLFQVIHADSDESEITAILERGVNRKMSEKKDMPGLSQRETEVLKEIAAGKTNKEIAESLCISVNTVITHRKNLTSKLGIRTAPGLSLYAVMNGLI